MTGRDHVAARWAGALVAVVLVGSCGVPDDPEPRTIAAENAPLDLDPSDDGGPASGEANVRLYFVDDSEEELDLVSVRRAVDQPSLDVAIDALLASEDEADRTGADGEVLTNLIPPDTTRLSSVIEGDLAIINLGCDEGAPPTCGILAAQQGQTFMYGQLTCTATSIRGINQVVFQVDGQPQPAALPDATTTQEPVACFMYD